MKLKYIPLVVIICIGVSGCSGENAAQKKPEPQHSQGQKDTKNESPGNNETAGTENKSGKSNSPNTSSENKENLPEGVLKRTYKSKEEAAASIKDYEIITETNMDLGHNIKAFAEGAAGHQYISWNEGRWLIRVNYPNDLQYAAQKGVDGETFAKSVVNYLEKNYLPAPKVKGVIKIGGFNNSPYTIIEWQDGNIVYEIKSEENNPMETLHKAVEMAKQ